MKQEKISLLFNDLGNLLKAESFLRTTGELDPFACDALTMYKKLPLCVALPESKEEVINVIKICNKHDVPIVTRGAGTGLSGGALPIENGVLLVTSKLRQIKHIDPLNRTAIVEPGVRNLSITEAAERYGLFYPPDPSSQIACTIGGNIAENSGGVKCLKYGLTVHNVISVTCINSQGEEFTVGGTNAVGYDLLSLVHGSEGMLAVVVEATVKLVAKPEATATLMCAFDSYQEGGDAVAAIISKGIVPAGLEMMDELAVEVVEEYLHLGYPKNAKLVMIVETDGIAEEANYQLEEVTKICKEYNARDFRIAHDEDERELIWKGRKSALPAVGQRATDYYCIDGTIPRNKLGYVLEKISEMSQTYNLPCANVFHAGDGNLHPLIMFHAGDKDEVERAQIYGSKILTTCLEVGGTVTGEHGVGIEKLNEMCVQFNSDELETFYQIKTAFDQQEILNPGKAIPTLQRCAEFGAMHVHKGQLPHPHLERF